MGSGMVSEFKVFGYLSVGGRPASVALILDGVEHHLDIETVEKLAKTLDGAANGLRQIQEVKDEH